MNEKEAEKRLKEIRKKLKRLKERRGEYIRSTKKFKIYLEIPAKTRENNLFFSAILSGVISMTVYFIFERFYAPEDLKIFTTLTIFFTLTYILYYVNELKRGILGERYLKIIDCLIDELENEEEELLLKFPEADRWVPSARPSVDEKSGSHHLTLLIELIFFVLSPTFTRGAFLLAYLGFLGSIFIITEVRRYRELKMWEKECEKRGKIVIVNEEFN